MFRDTCSLCAVLSIVATLCVGLEHESLKADILVIEDWWYANCSWFLNTDDCFVERENGLLTREPNFCCLISLGANNAQALQYTLSSDTL